MVTAELSLEVLVLSLSGIEVVRPPVPNTLETLIVWSLLGNVGVVVLSLSGIEINVLLVLETMDKLKVLSLVGIIVVVALPLPVVEGAVLFVPKLPGMAVVLSLSGSADVDVLSLSGNEVVTLSLLGTTGVTETAETTVPLPTSALSGPEDIEDGTGATEVVVLTWTVTKTEEGLSLSETRDPDAVLSVGLSSLLCDVKVKVRSLSGKVVADDREVVVFLSLSGAFDEVVSLSLSLSLSGVEVEEYEGSLSVSGRLPCALVTAFEMDAMLAEILSLSSEIRKGQPSKWKDVGIQGMSIVE